jgi:hypothetical protein
MSDRPANPAVSSGSDADPGDSVGRWRRMAATAADEFRERLGVTRYLKLSDRDRGRVARRLRETIDSAIDVPAELPERVAAEMERWSAKRDQRDAVALAWERTRERARRTAAIGAATAIPAVLPGFGSAIAALGLVADWQYVAEQQRDLALEIAALLGVTLEDPAREIRTLFLASAATSFGGQAAAGTVVKVAAGQVARRSLARFVPGVGVAVTGALNYLATLALGRAAIAQFAERSGRDVSGIVPAERDPRLPALRRAVVASLQTAQLADGEPPLSEWTPEQRTALAELGSADREELIDLAVVTAAGGGLVSPEEEPVLRELATLLRIEPARLEELRREAEADVVSFTDRFREIFRSAREEAGTRSQKLWRRAKKLARRDKDSP